jgi:hypothetical protein
MMNLEIFVSRMCNYLALFCLIILFSCSRKSDAVNPEKFEPVPEKTLLNPLVEEISGIADSESEAGIIWGIEDSGNPPQLSVIGHDAQVKGTIYLKGITNRDWEEMDVANGSVYIAETGDNSLQYPDYSIYKFSEPSSTEDTVYAIERIRFTYPDGSHDCEAMIVDPSTKDIYFFTKTTSGSKIYKLAFPYDATSVHTLTFMGQLSLNSVVGASLSYDQKEIIIKTYSGLNYYTKTSSDNIYQAVSKTAENIPYVLEPQGEAVSFAKDNSGYFTLSEKGFGSQVWLYKYKRK